MLKLTAMAGRAGLKDIRHEFHELARIFERRILIFQLNYSYGIQNEYLVNNYLIRGSS